MSLPKITVVTPSFNQAEFLQQTLESIHSANYPSLEHLVLDGGSTDGSVDIIRSFADRITFWVSEPDGGQTAALRRGFDMATGDIQCWLNSDDLFEPRTLFEVAEFFVANPHARFIYGDSFWIDRFGMPIKPKREHAWSRFVFMYSGNFIPQPSAFWRSDLYREVGGLDERFKLAMDSDLWIRFAEVTKPVHVRRSWSRMRFYPEQKNVRLRAISGVEGRMIRSRYQVARSAIPFWLRRRLARTIRVFVKLASGAYSPKDVVINSLKLVGRPSWEAREVAKAHRRASAAFTTDGD